MGIVDYNSRPFGEAADQDISLSHARSQHSLSHCATLGWRFKMMKSTVSAFRWHQFHKVIVMVAGFLIGTSVVTSALGFVFWWVAARAYSPQIVGSAAASISAMLLLSNLSTFGVGT